MSSTSARLLELLELLQSRRAWTGEELAARLGVTTRTVRANIAQLRELGYPVQATPGASGGYELGAGSRMAPLLLEDDEAVAVAVGLRTAANAGIAGIEEASVRALAKLGQVLPPRLGAKVEALQATIEPLRWTSPILVSAETLSVFAQACRDTVQVRFDYLDANGTATRRTAEPHALVPDGRRWYLVAFDLDRNDWRTFRVDRTDRPRVATRRFRRRRLPAEDAATFVRERIHRNRAVHHVVVTFAASADDVEVAFGHRPPGLVDDGDGGATMAADVESLDWLAARLAMGGLDFKVIEPPALAERLLEMAERMVRGAARS